MRATRARTPPDQGIPVLETERLVLRGHEIADLDDCAAMWADPLVTRHIGGRPLGAEEVWARVLRYAGLWSLLGFGYWTVRTRAAGLFVGEVGLADFRRAVVPAIDGIPEVGWALAPWAQGQGFATEAVRAALAWSDGELGAPETACLINPSNEASIRVAAKCGYHEAEHATYRHLPTIIYRRRAPAHGGAGPDASGDVGRA